MLSKWFSENHENWAAESPDDCFMGVKWWLMVVMKRWMCKDSVGCDMREICRLANVEITPLTVVPCITLPSNHVSYFPVLIARYLIMTWFLQYVPRKIQLQCKMEQGIHAVKLKHSGKSWPAKLTVYANSNAFFCQGWAAFVKENSLKMGDICMFEVIERNVFNAVFFRCA